MTLTNKDFDRIEQIAIKVSNDTSTSIIEKTIKGVLTAYGIHNQEEMQKNMVLLEDLRENRKEFKRSFISTLGGHMFTFVGTLLVSWVLFIKGMSGG